MTSHAAIILTEPIERRIFVIRGNKVMLSTQYPGKLSGQNLGYEARNVYQKLGQKKEDAAGGDAPLKLLRVKEDVLVIAILHCAAVKD